MRTVSSWVKCSDRLPTMQGPDGEKYSDDVLVCWTSRFGPPQQTVEIMHLHELPPGPHLAWGNEEATHAAEFDQVTHWMPLPDPPGWQEWTA